MSGRPPEPSQGRAVPFFDQGIYLLHLNRGKEALRLGHYEEARREFEDARRFRTQEPEVLANLAFALFHLGQYGEAETITRRVLTSFPSSVPLLFNLGLILFKAGRYEEAREPMEKVIQIAPGHRKAHLTVGLVLQRLGKTEEALSYFRAAGSELAAGGEGDDTLTRLARAAVIAPVGSGDGPGGGAPTGPIVRPEPLSDTNPALRRAGPVGGGSEASGPSVPARSGEPAGVSGPFQIGAGGLRSAVTAAGLVVRQDAIAGRRGFSSLEAATGLAGSLERLFLRGRGDGTLLLAQKGRHAWLLELAGDFLSVDPGRILAFEGTLEYREDPSFEFRPSEARPFLKLLGRGTVALAVVSEANRVPVSAAQPLVIAAESVVAYAGALEAESVPPGSRYAELGDRPLCRFTGNGTVFVDAG